MGIEYHHIHHMNAKIPGYKKYQDTIYRNTTKKLLVKVMCLTML
jgi:fatty acid desaturase